MPRLGVFLGRHLQRMHRREELGHGRRGVLVVREGELGSLIPEIRIGPPGTRPASGLRSGGPRRGGRRARPWSPRSPQVPLPILALVLVRVPGHHVTMVHLVRPPPDPRWLRHGRLSPKAATRRPTSSTTSGVGSVFSPSRAWYVSVTNSAWAVPCCCGSEPRKDSYAEASRGRGATRRWGRRRGAPRGYGPS